MAARRWWQRVISTSTGEPGKGVSSFHLWWLDAPREAVTAVSVTLEVLEPPTVSRLYFWALQATFHDGSRSYGGAHLGLQWNPRFPAARAANWGGYSDVGNVTSILEGTPSPLPSTPNDPNTRDYAWQASVPYRLRISHADEGWRGEITDLSSGNTQLVRHLFAPGDQLTSAVMWSEVFARCDHPAAAVRWSRPEWSLADGRTLAPPRVRATFPSGGDCPNTSIAVDDLGILQRTNAERTNRDGDVLALPA